ncbi:Predicted pyrophosphatase or phosphodiesterase, AlkP superfamily [Flagellimonas taeanensis]|uniref:Predicted pyrophosphatase or phosphodiesterase, AlkP superfamily n=1 Tax=Flagellimonas taeanensis TaxID=1005926 RepID=A0A1M6RBG1_9FLAO|nr:alkaline phosphatase PafA [Allomuricauda taeanensis]SFB74712.1 Predicted pyrophosphatase or phosphodiesterase, AlkP superfamily [Allomuricauda taeanensis]SHK29776.1 Predicted pyrophosphatase or phosphodiesterase, AlkP superfamily [Allomuricauda taeanensis]
MKSFFNVGHLPKILMVSLCFLNMLSAQQESKPKLVVGIVVDQMRAEYLYRFQDNYTEDGFKRLMGEGFNVKNMHYNYIPTTTGAGHSSVYTGTTPAHHGIVNNNWYSRAEKRIVYCAEDMEVSLVDDPAYMDPDKKENYSRSPKNLMANTITDELKLTTNGRSKVVGVSLKDRSAIFPSGHMADYAYWYHSGNDNFISSSYYGEKLPDWLITFNKRKLSDSLMNLTWAPFLPMERYQNSDPDDSPFEKIYKGNKKSVFPYNLKKLRKQNGDFAMLTEVPFGNTIVTEMAMATIDGEGLGKGKDMDFLALSYSSTDYVGHYFGIRSKELEDTYVRLDRELARLLAHLDKTVGKDNYLVFLTADHAASDHPGFLEQKGLPGSSYDPKLIGQELNEYLSKESGIENCVSFIDNTQVYLVPEIRTNRELLEKAALYLQNLDSVKEVFVPALHEWNLANSTIGEFVRNAYNSKNSGDILLHSFPGWMDQRDYGTTHGTAYTTDTHVPMLWYGWGVKQGLSVAPYTITQIAPTLSMLLDIPLPDASDRRPIGELFN